MFPELQLPEVHVTAGEVRYYVGTTSASIKYYLAGDRTLKELPWLFETSDEAILASAEYYHNNGYAYPWQTEMIAAGKRFLERESFWEPDNITVESQIMRFE